MLEFIRSEIADYLAFLEALSTQKLYIQTRTRLRGRLDKLRETVKMGDPKTPAESPQD